MECDGLILEAGRSVHEINITYNIYPVTSRQVRHAPWAVLFLYCLLRFGAGFASWSADFQGVHAVFKHPAADAQ